MRNRVYFIFWLFFLAVLTFNQGFGQEGEHSAIRPIPSAETRAASAGWRNWAGWPAQHEEINRIGLTRKVDLVFLGDSITQSWGGEGRNVWASAEKMWEKFYGNRHAANFGISGDRTEHVLWRIDHGNFDHISPRAIVVMIGTNNMPHNTAEEIAEGIEAIVHRLESKVPSAKILLLGVFPRGKTSDDPYRVKQRKVNGIVNKLHDGERVHFMDLSDVFLKEDGTADLFLMRDDFLHLRPEGYRIWAESIEETLSVLLNDRVSIIPQPVKLQFGKGGFTLTSGTKILVQEGSKDALRAAAQLVGRVLWGTGLALETTPTERTERVDGAILLTTAGADDGLSSEGYALKVTSGGVVLRAPAGAGLFYGVQTLLQLLPTEVFSPEPVEDDFVKWSIPSVTIEDRPRFKWRGLMLDASRHFQTKEYVKRYLDLMAMHKLNVFHWHLTDGHGWRIEIKRYPELTRVAAWRNQPGYDQGPYGGFYTQYDIREIVEYARDRYITIVPEIEMPGHSWEVFAAYPHLSCTGEKQEVAYFFDYPCREQKFPNMKGTDVFCAGREETFEFLEGVLAEVGELFQEQIPQAKVPRFIHIGGDEVDKKWWKSCPSCQARMKAEGLEDEHELQSYFIRRIEKFLNSKGCRLIGWDEILEGGLAPNATVMSWRGTEGGIAAARLGHDVVMCPQQALYFDHYQSAEPAHPPSWPGVNTLRTVYEYEPVPEELNPEEQKHILGAQANMWTCFTHTGELIDLMTYPRACALSEVTWSPRGVRDFDNFTRRMDVHARRLDLLGVHYFKSTSITIGSWDPSGISEDEGELLIDVSAHLQGPGEYLVTFQYLRGAHGLHLYEAALLEDGKEISRDTHEGFTGWKKEKINYRLELPALIGGARYMIKARVAGAGGVDSQGDIFFSKVRKE